MPHEDFPRICAITLGEIEAGHIIKPSTNQLIRDEFIAYVYEWFLPRALDITPMTRISYSEIIGKILEEYPIINPGQKTERHLVDIGVDINDVWIASVAHEHGLVLVTDDKMTKIRQVLEPSKVLKFDNWLK